MSFQSSFIGCLCASALLLPSLPLHAEEAPIQLDAVEVTARKTGSLTTPDIASDQALLDLTPGAASVVDSETYLSGRSSTPTDTFFLSPGVFTQSRFGSDEARISIRGSGLQRYYHGRGIRVMQDGIPLNAGDGNFDLQSVEPAAADHINIWRGGNALASGASTLGGAIDYISFTGRDAPAFYSRVEGGSFGTFRATAATGGVSGNFDAYASFTHSQVDGFRQYAQTDNDRFFANIGAQLSDRIETRLYLTAVKSDTQLPGALTKAEMKSDPKQADTSLFGAFPYRNRHDYDLYRIASKTSFELSPDSFVNLLAGFTVKDLDHPLTPFVGVLDEYSKDLTLGLNWDYSGDLFGRANRFRAGTLFTRGQTDSARYANVFGNRGALTSDASQTATNLEFFAENQSELGRGFTGILGANAGFNERKSAQHIGAAPSYDYDYHQLSPKLGIRWDNAEKSLQLYANISGSYEPPSFGEANTALIPSKAQTALSFELGSRGTARFIRWDASLYHSAVKNELLDLNDALGAPLGTINAHRTIHQGVELGLEADLLGGNWNTPETPAQRLVLRTAWTWGRFTFDDDPVYGNNHIAGLPEHLIRGELLWETHSGYYFGPTFEWVPSKSYVDHANSLWADPYALLGWKFGKRSEKGISYFIEAKNLTDKTYTATTTVIADALGVDTRAFYPGDGRSVFAGIEYRF